MYSEGQGRGNVESSSVESAGGATVAAQHLTSVRRAAAPVKLRQPWHRALPFNPAAQALEFANGRPFVRRPLTFWSTFEWPGSTQIQTFW